MNPVEKPIQAHATATVLKRSAQSAAAIAAVALALGAGCVASRWAGAPAAGPAHLAPKPGAAWSDALTEATRRTETYDYALRTSDLRATLVTPRLRKAFIDARCTFQGRFAEAAARELIGMGEPDEGVDAPMRAQPKSEEQVVLFVAMYVTDQAERDLAASYTVWETRLVRGDVSVAPIAVETVRSSPGVADIFPYVDRFDDLYIVRFPLADAAGHPLLSSGGSPLRLEVKSALAEAKVEWTLAD